MRQTAMSLLIVDDNARFREPFTRVLYHYLYIEAVLQAGSLAEAREKLEGIDLALIDRGLPDGDGLELITELREASPATKVLVMSATVEQLHLREAVESGADGVIDKIAPPEQIAAQIRALHDGG